MPQQPRKLYDQLARWWPLLSPPDEYAGEAADLLSRLGPVSAAEGAGRPTLLELGAGGGSLAFHLKRHFDLTLTDIAPGMLAVSRAVNPECEHLAGDMFALRLDRRFDAVLIHDAIQYATTPDQVRAALRTAAFHCRPGGRIAVLPDFTREIFQPGTDHGGRDGPDGRALRYLEWAWDPDPTDHTFLVEYAFLLREADGGVAIEQDRHEEGLFARADWLGWLAEAEFTATCEPDPFGRDVFLGTRGARPLSRLRNPA
ncbi:MAG TPA: class I SAM-dependent methyltransferase [Gemmatimonadales bacterium]|nr:class I SAM-dependent methyltransferase [Gemmatimonadales bacterium]